MMTTQDGVHTLNAFLKGQYMGIHAYEHHIPEIERS